MNWILLLMEWWYLCYTELSREITLYYQAEIMAINIKGIFIPLGHIRILGALIFLYPASTLEDVVDNIMSGYLSFFSLG